MKSVAALLSSLIAIGVLALGSLGGLSAAAGDLDTTALGTAVLGHPSIHLRPTARKDVEHGLVDARVLAVLLVLAERHELTSVGPLMTGHSYYVSGTSRPSNHSFGRAVDITAVDGTPVSSTNLGARDAVELVLSLAEPIRPDEVGSPWRFPSRGSFADKAHLDHVHLGWDQP